MSKQLAHKLQNRGLRAKRVRSRVIGSPDRPRLSIKISNIHISAQLIDDASGRTIGYASTVGQKSLRGSMTEKAAWVGEEITKQAKTAKIKSVVYDRGGKLYHGRVAALADAARKAGLEF
jgi:large subunit ribosomal protein L18